MEWCLEFCLESCMVCVCVGGVVDVGAARCKYTKGVQKVSTWCQVS